MVTFVKKHSMRKLISLIYCFIFLMNLSVVAIFLVFFHLSGILSEIEQPKLLLIPFFVIALMTIVAGNWIANHFVLPIEKWIRKVDSEEKHWDNLLQKSELITEAIQETSVPVGVFLMDYANRTVFLSDKLFEILQLEKGADNSYDLDDWNEIYCNLLDCREVLTENIYIYRYGTGERRWLKVKYSISQDRNLGVMIDLTEDYLTKYRLAREREIDTLTKLPRRAAFLEKATEVLEKNSSLFSMVIVAELGKIRDVKELYGYDLGDVYIKYVASILDKFTSQKGLQKGILARTSDNQFALCLYGYPSEERLFALLNELLLEIDTEFLVMPDGFKQKILLNVGYSCYPRDSKSVEVLLCYANFALYEVRIDKDERSKRFELIHDFSSIDMEYKNQVLSRLIELNLFDYAFQPIVDVRSGEIYGYEALMRSRLKDLKSPMDIFQLAKTTGYLAQIEKLTFFNLHEWVKQNVSKLNGKKIFINSIPEQIISDDEVAELKRHYGKYMRYVVHEYLESEEPVSKIFLNKFHFAKDNAVEIAIDDWKSAERTDSLLETVSPAFVKISMSLVKGIDQDTHKSSLFGALAEKARSRGIKVIALGVENQAELETVIHLGADYVQGYYIKEPEYTLPSIPDVIKRRIMRIYEGMA